MFSLAERGAAMGIFAAVSGCVECHLALMRRHPSPVQLSVQW